MSALEPLLIKAAFWQHADVKIALVARDVGALFRLVRQHCGASQHRIGTAVDIQQGTVSAIMKGDRTIASIDVLERIADGLDMPDHARMRLGLAPKEGHMRRRTALGIGLVAAISPATLTNVLRESAAEAVEFTRERGMTAVGSGTLDHLTTVIAGLDRSYPWQPATELFPLARTYRQHVQQLLNGQHTLAEARELHVHAAYLSHILSDLSYDLGSIVAAKAYAIDSYQLAEQAGHAELCAWAADSLAVATRFTDRPRDTADAATKGLRHVPRRHPLAARLHARAAEGHALAGNRDACTDALAKARAACDRLPADMPSRFTNDTAEHVSYSIASYGAFCHLTLRDWRASEQYARGSLGVGKWSPGREAQSQITLATALVHMGSPDEAAELGTQTPAFGRGGFGSMLPRARLLDTALMARYPDEPSAKDFHDRYQQLAARAITN